jgi:hypothetical protein
MGKLSQGAGGVNFYLLLKSGNAGRRLEVQGGSRRSRKVLRILKTFF